MTHNIEDKIIEEFFKMGRYCTQCVGNIESHVPGCPVPEQIEQAQHEREVGG